MVPKSGQSNLDLARRLGAFDAWSLRKIVRSYPAYQTRHQLSCQTD